MIVQANSKKDFEFSELLIQRCEVEKNFSLCLLYRDDIPGCAMDEVLACLIEQRCRHVIVVLSPALINNEFCQKQLQMAAAANSESLNKVYQGCVSKINGAHVTITVAIL